MSAEEVRLGPLECRVDSVSVESRDSVVLLNATGVSVVGPEPLNVSWAEVMNLEIVGPAMARRWDLALKVLDLVSPVVGLRSGRTQIRVQSLARNHAVEVEPGSAAPYDYRDLDAVEALIASVGEAGSWSYLGNPQWLLPVMRQAATARSWLTPLTHRRVRQIVKSALP